MTKETKHLILEMSVGIIGYNILLCILAAVFKTSFGYSLVPIICGLLTGMASAILMLIHMGIMTERVLDSGDSGYANRTTVVHAMLRKLVLVAGLLCCWKFLHFDMVAMIIGVLGLKAGAYLQPIIHKAFNRNHSEESACKIEERRTVYGNDDNADFQ